MIGRTPARSPDLSPPDFVSKDSVYGNQHKTEEELKDAIETEIKAIVEYMCKKIFKNMLELMDACQAICDGQFQHWL